MGRDRRYIRSWQSLAIFHLGSLAHNSEEEKEIQDRNRNHASRLVPSGVLSVYFRESRA